MYKRHVVVVLIMLTLSTVLSAVLANIDPFQTNAVWTNFIVLVIIVSLGAIIAFTTSVVLLNNPDKDDADYFGNTTVMIGGGAAIAAIGCEMASSMIAAAYHGLMWGSYGLAIAIMVLVVLISYLIKPSDDATSGQSHLKRVA